MEQLDRLARYFNERERKRLEAKVKESGSTLPDMTVSLSTCVSNFPPP